MARSTEIAEVIDIASEAENPWEVGRAEFRDLKSRIEHLEQRAISPGKIVYTAMANYLLHKSSATPSHSHESHSRGELTIADILRLRSWLHRDSIVEESRAETPSSPILDLLLHAQKTAEKFKHSFPNLLERITAHTNFASSLRQLREMARKNRNTPFYRALVDIHDCLRSTHPEDMDENMVPALRQALGKLNPSLTNSQMLEITDLLHAAHLSPWPKQKSTRIKRSARRAEKK